MEANLAKMSRKKKDRRGSKPGERRGGRKKGTRNKAVVARKAMRAEAMRAAKLSEIPEGSKSAKDVLLKVMHYWEAALDRLLKNPNASPLDVEATLNKLQSAAKDAARFTDPTFQSVEHRGTKDAEPIRVTLEFVAPNRVRK